jgi:competence protein ComEC
MPFGLEKWPLLAAEKSLEVIMAVAREAASWPHAGYQVDAWPVWILGVISLGGLWLMIWQGWIRYAGIVMIAAAAVFIPFVPRPDVLVSDNGRIFAVRGEDEKLWVSSSRIEKFVRNEWIEREGNDGGYGFWTDREKQDARDIPVRCDVKACVYHKNGKTVSFIDMPEALSEECARGTDIVISNKPLADELCRGKETVIIDKWDIRENGAHEIYLGGREVSPLIKTVFDSRGNRPWTIQGRANRKTKSDS